jgi:predicted phosphodiesterase
VSARTALLSDAHGNAVALRAVLAELDAEGIDRAVCLGDMLQGGPHPAECLELLRERGWPAILGNADALLLDPATAEGSAEQLSEAVLEAGAWSRAQLSDEQADVVAAWAPSLDVDLGHGRRLLAFHATPSSYHPLVWPTQTEEEFRRELGPVDADVAAGGHTHLPFVRRVGRTLFVNPGSVGFGYDHEQPEEGFALDPWASYAVIHSAPAGLRVELRRLAFDPAAVARALRSCGMPGAEERAAMWDRAVAAV